MTRISESVAEKNDQLLLRNEHVTHDGGLKQGDIANTCGFRRNLLALYPGKQGVVFRVLNPDENP